MVIKVVYNFNPCSQTTVKNKQNTKKKTKTLLMVLVFATLGLRQKLPFCDVPDVGIPAKNIYIHM